MQWRGVRRLSVCLSLNFCANRFFSQANGRIATKLAHDGLQVSVHPGYAPGQGQRSRALFWILGMSYSVIDGLVCACSGAEKTHHSHKAGVIDSSYPR